MNDKGVSEVMDPRGTKKLPYRTLLMNARQNVSVGKKNNFAEKLLSKAPRRKFLENYLCPFIKGIFLPFYDSWKHHMVVRTL